MQTPKNIQSLVRPLVSAVTGKQPSLGAGSPSAGAHTPGRTGSLRRASFASGTVSPPQAGQTPLTGGRTGVRPSVPVPVGELFADMQKLDPRASGGQRSDDFRRLIDTSLPRLDEAQAQRTESGRDEFIAGNARTALLWMPTLLKGWKPEGGSLVKDGKAQEYVWRDRRSVADDLSPPRQAHLASALTPPLCDKLGLKVSRGDMAGHGALTDGPRLTESELMALYDYVDGETGMFNLVRANTVLSQHLGAHNNPFGAYVDPYVKLLASAVAKLEQHPGFKVSGDFFKGLALDKYQARGLEEVCSTGKLLPLGEAGTSAVSDPSASYLRRTERTDRTEAHGAYNAELMMRNVTGVRVDEFHSSTDPEPEVIVPGGQQIVGAGKSIESFADPRTGSVVPYTRYIVQGRPDDRKGPA